MYNNQYKMISVIVILSFLIVFMAVSCKAAPVETIESETIATEATPPETTPVTEVTISTDKTQNFIAEYTVQSGDTLGQIAKNFYGYDSQPYWELIYEANKDTIESASLIFPGQILKIPELPEEMK